MEKDVESHVVEGVGVVDEMELWVMYNNAIDAQRNQTERLDYYDSVITPKYVTDLAFEKQLASVYTDRMFRVVQEFIAEADKSCRMISMSTLENIEVFKVSDARKKTFTVTHEIETESYECECKLFLRCGYLCSHLFFILRNKDVNNIPEKYEMEIHNVPDGGKKASNTWNVDEELILLAICRALEVANELSW
ncbi:protein FAR1-RELATED SEQUENCE 2-like [Salvia hispanica]|uniref:protein FAR1-RELATED SEQUENCE 2-like n=1 Tax=Salvia hispanica TaxID=49212 RepID=UPI0020094E51|nr:protein FAR1-RELATED SEQUENCE 2-like [Salvia hispanica]